MKYRHGLHYDYPSDQHGHMIDPKQVRKNNLNNKYPYYGKSFGLKFMSVVMELFIILIATPFCKLKFGLKKIGKREFKKKYKKLLKDGFISVSNHVFDEDYLCIRSFMQPRRGRVILWHNNHLRRMGTWIRFMGSIPIPKNDMSATLAMMHGVDDCLKDKNWIQIYPEASMFYYYEGVREFVDGAAMFAVRNNKPIVPFAFSFRPVTGIYKLWKRKGYPCVNLSIGEPLFPNKDLPFKEAIKDLNDRARNAVIELMEKNTPEVEEK